LLPLQSLPHCLPLSLLRILNAMAAPPRLPSPPREARALTPEQEPLRWPPAPTPLPSPMPTAALPQPLLPLQSLPHCLLLSLLRILNAMAAPPRLPSPPREARALTPEQEPLRWPPAPTPLPAPMPTAALPQPLLPLQSLPHCLPLSPPPILTALAAPPRLPSPPREARALTAEQEPL